MTNRMRLTAASFATLLVAIICGAARADVQLASPFTDHMVLQRELAVPIWGTADPGAAVSVEFAGQTQETKADDAGKWRVDLAPLEASKESRTLTVKAGDASAVTLDDVLVGEVWLASGQSNMDFSVAKTEKFYFAGVHNEAEEVAAANYPTIRHFRGQWTKAYEPQERVEGEWQVCTPENVREWSAVGYFFARDLQKEIDVPVGIVTLTFGASCSQAWIRREAIEADAELKPLLEQFDRQVAEFRARAASSDGEEGGRRRGRGGRDGRRGDPTQDQHNPTVMYNGMIAPVVPFAIRGVLWYQGESITEPKDLFPRWNETLIKDWRALWGRELPFYFVQLAAHDKDSNSPRVRAWQAEALKLPATGMAVTIDIGDHKDVHPHNKQDVGKRLALIALANAYGRDVEFSGPQFESVAADGDALKLTFSHADGLAAKGGEPLNTFEVAGADGEFQPADATLEGDVIVVRSDAVKSPKRVRYAWANFPENPNLVNASGLPAPPFEAAVE